MKTREITENDLVGLFFIGLGITVFAVFSVISGFSKITGMVAGKGGELGDATAVYTLMALISVTFLMIMFAMHLMKKK